MRPVPFRRYGFLPPSLTWPRVFPACLPCRGRVAGSVFLRVPRGAILLPVMAGGAWRGMTLSMLAYFAAATRKAALRPFQGCAEAGYRAEQDMHKPGICTDRARSVHKLAKRPVPMGCIFLRGTSFQGVSVMRCLRYLLPGGHAGVMNINFGP